MPKNYKSDKKYSKNIDPYDFDHLSASSATDCTGLIPVGADCDAELESYEEIYPYQPKAVVDKNEKAKLHTNV